MGWSAGPWVGRLPEFPAEGEWDVRRVKWLLSFRHCIDLFLDFVTLFRKLMLILAFNEKDKKKEKK